MSFPAKSWLNSVFPVFCAGLFLAIAAPAFADEAVARRLLNSQGCKACHPFESQGESLAPDLSKVGSRLKKAEISQRLVSADHRHASGRIADFSHLRSAEIEALVTFLSERR